jgi:hypothetical protein
MPADTAAVGGIAGFDQVAMLDGTASLRADDEARFDLGLACEARNSSGSSRLCHSVQGLWISSGFCCQ